MNPDFVNTNGQKKVIEVFGDYWHGSGANRVLDTIEGRERALKKVGFRMLAIWEREINPEHESLLLEKIRQFTGSQSWQLGLPYIYTSEAKQPKDRKALGPAPLPMPSRDELFQFYLISQLTPKQLALKCEVSTPTIRKWLRLSNIPSRSYSESARLRIATYPETNPAYVRWGPR